MTDTPSETALSAAEQVLGALRDAAQQAHGFMHYGTFTDCKAAICVRRFALSRATLDAARSQPATEGLTRLRKAAQAVIDSCIYVDGTAQEMADDRALDRLRAALAATEPAGDERT